MNTQMAEAATSALNPLVHSAKLIPITNDSPMTLTKVIGYYSMYCK